MNEIRKNNEEIIEFIELLLEFSKNEKLMDNNRCLLSQDLYFDTSSLYNYILFKFSEEKFISKNIMALSTLKKFILEDLDIQIANEILSKIFDFCSTSNFYEGERFLDFIEFCDIFYPRYNLTLRKYMIRRSGLNKDMKALNSITKILLQNLFIRQINMIKYLLHYNDKINIDYKNLFNKVSNNKIFITKHDLINLFTNENIYFKKEDIDLIITNFSYNNKNFYSSKNTNIIEGIYYKSFENIFNIPKKIFPTKPLTEKEKISVMKSIIMNSIYQEKKVEEAKELIVKREDFNFNSLLNLFINEKINKNNDKIEFAYFIKKLNLSLDETEYELLLRRIDLLRKRYLYKSDLYEFFIPFNEDCRQKIKNEENKDINMNTNLKNSFSKGTMIYINNLINIVIKGEKEINMKKKKLNNEDDFIEKIFNDICNISKNDNNENKYNDYFNKEQLFKYLTEILNLEISEDDMNLFFIRLDKLRRGKIQILEFSDEMKCINLKYF